MAKRRRNKKVPVPRFPPQKWQPGQAPRIEKPKKGRGSYERGGQRRAALGEIIEDLPET